MKRAFYRPVIGVTSLPATWELSNETPELSGATYPFNKSREDE